MHLLYVSQTPTVPDRAYRRAEAAKLTPRYLDRNAERASSAPAKVSHASAREVTHVAIGGGVLGV